MRLKKDYVVFEYAGKAVAIKQIEDFNEDIKSELKNRFNELSKTKK
jgi:hypothetical protein